MRARLIRLRSTLPYVWQLWIIDDHGNPRATTMENAAGVNIADRDYFTVHRTGDHGLYVSPPFRGSISGQVVFVLSRRIPPEDGWFDGVAVLSLDPNVDGGPETEGHAVQGAVPSGQEQPSAHHQLCRPSGQQSRRSRRQGELPVLPEPHPVDRCGA
jgi:hypothetical protein